MYVVMHTPPLLGAPIPLGEHDDLAGALKGIARVFDNSASSRSDGYKRDEADYRIARMNRNGKVGLLLTVADARASVSGART